MPSPPIDANGVGSIQRRNERVVVVVVDAEVGLRFVMCQDGFVGECHEAQHASIRD